MKNQRLILAFILMFGLLHKVKAQETSLEKSNLRHVLLFDWLDNVDESKKEEVLNLFKGLTEKIDGFEHININEIIDSSGDFDIVIIMEFVNSESLEAYEKHADHVKISKMAPSLLNGFFVFDFHGKF
ncbi:Dabb family protein [uncultured Croceitalea sp.]|uniref:Dabb family protein n=1 Tax=uncultured Croceitalea sp. TaxID=1798908 RepID=UPI0033063761